VGRYSRSQHTLAGHPAQGLLQRDVRAHVDHAQPGARQEHGHIVNAGPVSEKFGMPGPGAACQPHCLFVQRCSDDRIYLCRQCEIADPNNVSDRSPPGCSGYCARWAFEWRGYLEIEDLQGPEHARRIAETPRGLSRQTAGCQPSGCPIKYAPVSCDQGAACGEDGCVSERVEHDLGSDSGGISHRDRDSRKRLPIHRMAGQNRGRSGRWLGCGWTASER